MSFEQETPRQVDDPRPPANRFMKWPLVLMGTAAIGVLGGITLGPMLLSSAPHVAKAEPADRSHEPRLPHGLADSYEDLPKDEPKAEDAKPAEPAASTQTQTVQQNSGGGGPTGPTKAEFLKAARMAELKPLKLDASYEGEGGGGSAGGGGTKLNGKHRLVEAYPCQVNAATNIPAMMEQLVSSEATGTVSAVVMRDTWSSDKRCMAIPRGTRFTGRYQAGAAEGQTRLGIVWTALTRPPPRKDTIDLDDTVAGDPDGSSGVTGEVDAHFWSNLAYVAAASVLDIGKTAITAGGEGGVGAAVAGIFAGRASSPIDEWAKKKLERPPTITVKPREISIVLAQHLPMNEFRRRK